MSIYTNTPRLVLGFHGCEEYVAEKVLNGKEHLKPSKNDYDWLGHGIYFWENDPVRAYEFAKKYKKDPAVIGAVIDLGNCFSLMERRAIRLLQLAYADLKLTFEEFDKTLPKNAVERHGHKLLRRLDCAVFENMHEVIKKLKTPPYDTAIGTFLEGDCAYPGTELSEQAHIQICVRSIDCIKGYFLPLENYKKEND